jgi:hypothetical protein
MDPGGQGVGGEAGPLVWRGGLLAGQRAQHGLVLGVARVGGAQVHGHHPPARRAGVVVDDHLHDLFVQARLVGPAAQDVGEVAAGFGEQVVFSELRCKRSVVFAGRGLFARTGDEPDDVQQPVRLLPVPGEPRRPRR